MYESADIITYLHNTYGQNDIELPGTLDNSLLTTISLSISSLFRLGKGSKFIENSYNTGTTTTGTGAGTRPGAGAGIGNKTPKPLIYWGYEGSPFCKLVRERLVEFEIPHLQRTCPRGSEKRDELYRAQGRFQVYICI